MENALENYHKAVRFLEGLSNSAGPFLYMHGGAPDPTVYLDRTRWLLQELGNPQDSLRYVHVAGTAGKGTVSALIHDMLVRNGKKVGLFTSPFATTSLEKIKVGETYISPELFAELVEEIKPALDASLAECPYGRPAYFEIFFALAILAFKHTGCEWAVIEVGCGGTYDATNVIPAPEVAVITTIDYDHMHLLGNTLAEIAGNKAGIIKSGSQVWTSERRPELRELFQKACEERGAFYHEIDPALEHYQDRNQAVAQAVGKYLEIPESLQQEALKSVRLPCRFEEVQTNPRVILDGAHNAAKVRAAVSRLKMLHYNKLHLIIGMAEDKDASAMLKEIIPLADVCYYTRFQTTHREAFSPEVLQKSAQKPGKIFLDPFQALDRALAAAAPEDIILVIGSFFLSGELRTRWYSEEWILKNQRSF
jgi:dihydrofolate synthase/folylpolyglutamate synthase